MIRKSAETTVWFQAQQRGKDLGLDFFSAPMRLALVVAIAASIVLLSIRLIARRNKSAKTSGSKDSMGTTHNPLNSSGMPDTQASFVNAQVSENLAEISKLSETLMKAAPSPEVRAQSEKILNAAHNAQLAIHNEVLVGQTDAANTSFKPLSFDFKTLIKSIAMQCELRAETSDVAFTWHVDEKIPSLLYVDPSILRQVLNSLLNNSKAMTAQGRIHLHVTGDNTSDYNWKISMIVADTGRGFPKAFKDTVRGTAEAHTPTDANQVNVLASRKLMRKIQGTLKLSSVEGRGTEITLEFPTRAAMVMARESKSKLGIKSSKPSNSLRGKKVLIIEDDASSQEVLKSFLAPEGCEIDTILDGEMAIETLSNKSYDLILMDVRMDGLDGIKTTQAIRTAGKVFSNIPIITITADVDPDTNAKCMMAGADLFLNKPIGTKALFDGIRFVMDVGFGEQLETVTA